VRRTDVLPACQSRAGDLSRDASQDWFVVIDGVSHSKFLGPAILLVRYAKRLPMTKGAECECKKKKAFVVKNWCSSTMHFLCSSATPPCTLQDYHLLATDSTDTNPYLIALFVSNNLFSYPEVLGSLKNGFRDRLLLSDQVPPRHTSFSKADVCTELLLLYTCPCSYTVGYISQCILISQHGNPSLFSESCINCPAVGVTQACS